VSGERVLCSHLQTITSLRKLASLGNHQTPGGTDTGPLGWAQTLFPWGRRHWSPGVLPLGAQTLVPWGASPGGIDTGPLGCTGPGGMV
jgi:hypothetical protein